MVDRHGDPGGDSADRFSRHGEMVARKFYLIVGLFVTIVLCILALDRFQAYMLDSVRAYVAGEGYWSKGQKDGVYHLVRYASSFDEAEYRQFQKGIAVSLGDRQAKQALQQQPPDIARARQGLLAGRNHPEDLPRIISFFLHFSRIGPMKKALVIWDEGDGQIDVLRHLGKRLHDEVKSGHPDPARIRKILKRIDAVNARVTGLEYRFSDTLDNAARLVSRLTNAAMLASSLLLLLIGIVLSRQIVRGIRRTEAALVDSEARFRHVVESNIVGIMFCTADGTITDANDAFLAIVGHTRDELAKGMLNRRELTPEDLQTRDDEAWREIRKKGYCSPYEKEFLHKGGHRVAVYMGAACLDAAGENGVCFALDISDKKRAEQLQRLAAAVFHAAAEAIIVTDTTPVIKAVNPAFTRITGYAPEEVVGRNPSLLGSGHNDRAFYQAMWKHLATSGSWKGEIRNRRKNGDIYQEWLSISVIHDDKGEVSEYIGVFSDITEQRRMEEQLKQAQKMEAIGTLVGGIAHDFNNTLAAVQGNLYLAKKYNADNPRVTEKLDTIDRLSTHSAEIVQQLLTFARKGIVRMAPLSLNAFLARLQRIAAPIMPEDIAFDMQVCEEELTITGDETQLQQAILQLLHNARDAVAASADPGIICRLERFTPDKAFRRKHPELATGPLAHVIIRDNGHGIAEDDVERIFEPFYTTKEVGKGTGLGMSMVYGSMQTHRGIVEIQSAPAKGTSVHLYLPLAAAEAQQGVEPPPQRAAAAGRAPTVLLVDDDTNVRTVCSEALGDLGYRVLTADDGETALACFARHRDEIDLVVTDIVMPRMGGFAVAESLRRQQAELPIIFMTGYDPQHAAIPERLAPNSSMLSKPFPLATLAAEVRRLLVSGTRP